LPTRIGPGSAPSKPLTPGANEIRVRAKAAALNRADLLVLAGHQHGSVGGADAILSLECVGEVESLGQGVTGFAIGDRVMCSARHAMAEYVVTGHRPRDENSIRHELRGSDDAAGRPADHA
jgi:NADPH:quinone reductase-like Zn-dependent oxidoreductase